jgi:hypothetical protein
MSKNPASTGDHHEHRITYNSDVLPCLLQLGQGDLQTSFPATQEIVLNSTRVTVENKKKGEILLTSSS